MTTWRLYAVINELSLVETKRRYTLLKAPAREMKNNTLQKDDAQIRHPRAKALGFNEGMRFAT